LIRCKPLAVFIFIIALAAPYFAQTQSAHSNQGQNKARLAQNLERRGGYKAALQLYMELFQAVPHNQSYYEGVKRNLEQLKQYDKLLEIIAQKIENENHVRYHADMGAALYSSGKSEEAFARWDEAMLIFKESQQTYMHVANAMIKCRLYDQAIDIYLRGRQDFNNANIFVFELANIYALRLMYEKATFEYLKQLEVQPNQFNYIESRIANYTKEPEQAKTVAKTLQSYLKNNNDNYFARKLLADLWLRVEEYLLALEQFRKLEKLKDPTQNQRNSRGKELFFFAQKALKAESYEFAQEAFEMILGNYPKSIFTRRANYYLAVSMQGRGLSEDALRAFEEVAASGVRDKWSEEAQFSIGEIYLKSLFSMDLALAAFQQLINDYPSSRKLPDAYFRIGDCYMAQGKFIDAQTWFERAMSFMKAGAMYKEQGNYKIAYLQYLNGNYDSALEKLNEIAEKIGSPEANQSVINDALELIFFVEENRAEDDQVLRTFCTAEKLILARQNKVAADTLRKMIADYPKVKIVDDALLKLGQLEYDLKNYEAAISYFKKLVDDHEASPHAALASKRLAEVYDVGLADLVNAYSAYQNFLVEYPDSIYVEEVRSKLRELHGRRLNN